MLSPLRLARLAWHTLRLVADPTNLGAVFGIVRAVNTPEQLADQRERLRAHPRAAAAMDARFRLGEIDVDALQALPEGTLGRVFADFVRDNGIEPQTLTDQTVGESEWVSIHMYETHDILHVLIDADITPLGEVKLQSFVSAQMPWERLAPVAIAVGFLRAALGHHLLTPHSVLEAVGEGRALGKRADLVFGVDFSQRWEEPLVDIQRELGLVDDAVAVAA